MGSIWDWLGQKLTQLWTDFQQWAIEFVAWIADSVLSVVASAVEAIDTPEFLDNGLASVIGALPNDVVYFLGQSGFGAAIALVGAGVAFRIVRKIVTLGQW